MSDGGGLWGSLASCGRLSIGPFSHLLPAGGGSQGTLWVARMLPTCPTGLKTSELRSDAQGGGLCH